MAESHPVRFHLYPQSWTSLGDGPFVQMPLAEVTISGSVIACLVCGSVVVPGLIDVHERLHQRSGDVR
jgi:hypothetical protein